MIKREWDLLFSKYDLGAVLESPLKKVNDEVLQIDKHRFEKETDELLSASVASKLVVSPIELLEDKISVSVADVKVDVRHDFNRVVIDRSRPAYVDGVEVTYHLPLVGEMELLHCRPNTFTHDPPRAVIHSSNELTFPYDQANRDVSATKHRFAEDLGSLKQWVLWVNEQVAQYNASLEARVRQRVERRRQELKKTEADLSLLGYPVRTQTTEPNAARPPSTELAVAQRKTRRDKKRREYDVALSFAGEDRDYAGQVAEQLVELGVTVFYDRFEQVNLWGKDLAEHLV